MSEGSRELANDHGRHCLGSLVTSRQQHAFGDLTGNRRCRREKTDCVSRKVNPGQAQERKTTVRSAQAVSPANGMKQFPNTFRDNDWNQTPTEQRELPPKLRKTGPPDQENQKS